MAATGCNPPDARVIAARLELHHKCVEWTREARTDRLHDRFLRHPMPEERCIAVLCPENRLMLGVGEEPCRDRKRVNVVPRRLDVDADLRYSSHRYERCAGAVREVELQ